MENITSSANCKFLSLMLFFGMSYAHSAERTRLYIPPARQVTDRALYTKHCTPCDGGTTPFTNTQEDLYVQEVPRWSIERQTTHKLFRRFSFSSFHNAVKFVDTVATIAEREQHYPEIIIFYNQVCIELHTHAIKGLSENDFILAAHIDTQEVKLRRLGIR